MQDKRAPAWGRNCKAPCRECQDRKPGCHSSCERYKAYKDNADAERESRRKWKKGQ